MGGSNDKPNKATDKLLSGVGISKLKKRKW